MCFKIPCIPTIFNQTMSTRLIEERAAALIAQHGSASAATSQVQQQQQVPQREPIVPGSAADPAATTNDRLRALIAQHGSAVAAQQALAAARIIAQPRARPRPTPQIPVGLRTFQDTDPGAPKRANVGNQDKICPLCSARADRMG
ncbi:hypothetical protein DFS34DRAFT_590359 [Phlyctochytrium arcticum]|nr:hypothetical protein DFS34DRAFT_590359 [Phlyctochytrium arcticum]